ncbi:sushi, von Willebrand factor type A, EGF and pentraxin domain-containing 1, partial [Paramuricea clavata]
PSTLSTQPHTQNDPESPDSTTEHENGLGFVTYKSVYINQFLDPCVSNPCTNAESCVKDVQLGYRCQNCHSQYHGPKCEEHVDPCSSNPCQNGGKCISTMTSWRCVCPFPFHHTVCTRITRAYQFDLNGTADYPYASVPDKKYNRFTLNFLFKTAEQNASYLIHYAPDKSSQTERLSVWRVGNTFFVELWKDYVYTFTFPLSYPVNDKNWHTVTIVLESNAELRFYLDGVTRESPKLTKGNPGSSLYVLRAGTLYIGYFK